MGFNNLKGWYKLIGSISDSSGENRHGVGTITYVDSDVLGQGANINSNNFYIPLSSSSFTNSSIVTLSFWIYNKNAGSNGLIGTVEGGRTLNVYRYPAFNDFHGSFTSGGFVDVGKLPFDTWTHVTLSFDGTNCHRYYNGIYYTSSVASISPTSYYFFIGTNDSGNSTCILNDVRFYDKCLSNKEIREVYLTKILHYPINSPLEFATTNYVLNGDFKDGKNGWYPSGDATTHTIIDTPYGKGLRISRENGDGGNWPCAGTFRIPFDYAAGETWVWSFKFRTTRGGAANSMPFAIGWWIDDGGMRHDLTKTATSLNNGWYLCEAKHTFGSSGSYSGAMFMNSNYDYTTVEIADVQLEKAVNATAFTPTSRSASIKDISGFGPNMDSTYLSYSSKAAVGTGSMLFTTKNEESKPDSTWNPRTKLSWGAWIYMESYTAPASTIICKVSAHFLEVDKDGHPRIYWYGKTTPGWFISTAVIPLNKWVHLFAVYGDTNAKIYVNGELVSTFDVTGKGDTSVGRLMIGNRYGTYNMRGNIQDCRIYANELTAADVLDIYNVKASISKSGDVLTKSIYESTNYAYKIDRAIKNKTFADGLSSYGQPNCVNSLTDSGYNIFRNPNLTYPGSGTVMWGGFVAYIPEGTFLTNRKYLISWESKGQSSNNCECYFAYVVGWTSMGGLHGIWPGNLKIHGPNYNSSTWQPFHAIFDLTGESVYATATNNTGGLVVGNSYYIMRELKIGYTYEDTGSLGTDIYIRNFRVHDITDISDSNNSIQNTGLLKCNEIDEYNFTTYANNNRNGKWQGRTISENL